MGRRGGKEGRRGGREGVGRKDDRWEEERGNGGGMEGR